MRFAPIGPLRTFPFTYYILFLLLFAHNMQSRWEYGFLKKPR